MSHDNASSRNDETTPGNLWLAVISLALGTFSSVTTELLPIGLIPGIVQSFDISTGQAGLMVTIPGLLAAIAGPGVMISAGKLNRREVLLFLSLLLIVSCFLSYWAPSYLVMLFSRALLGISLGAFWTMALAIPARLVKENRIEMATAVVFAGVTAAMVIGVPLITFIGEWANWREAFLVIGIVAAAALALQVFTLPSLPSTSALRVVDLRALIGKRAICTSMAIIALSFGAHSAGYTFLSPILQRSGFDGQNVTLILLAFGLIGFVSNFVVSSIISGRLTPVMSVTVWLMLFVMTFLPLVQALPWVTVTLVMVWGIAFGTLPLCLNLWHQSVSGDQIEAGTALFTLALQTAIAVGSAIGGVIVDRLGISAALWFAGLLMATCLVLVIYPKNGQGEPSGVPNQEA